MFKDLFSLKGRVALVTGGSRGIGKMIAAGFLAQGAARVYITARKAGPCEATAKELTAQYDGECIALGIDISTVEGCEKLAAEIIKHFRLPSPPVWIEHHPQELTNGQEETFDLVTFAHYKVKDTLRGGVLHQEIGQPTRKRLDRASIEVLVGQEV